MFAAGFFKFISKGSTEPRVFFNTPSAIQKNPDAILLKCDKKSREQADKLHDYFLDIIQKKKSFSSRFFYERHIKVRIIKVCYLFYINIP